MSKKYKIKKKTPGPVPDRSSETRTAPVPAQTSKKGGGKGVSLILFDNKTKVFLGLLILIYIVLSSLKIHTSNIGNWDTFFGLEKSDAVIAGKPRFIRMDEWMITSTSIIGQYEMGLPLKNESNGGGNAAVAFGLPIKDISSILLPSSWPYFVFDIERAFAFSWNFNVFFFLISMFLLFMLLTRNNFWLSVFGTFFIFWAPCIQWWSYIVSTYMMQLNGMAISFIYLLYSRKALPLVISSIVLIFSIFSFISHLYPPFQVPLIYLYAFIAIGYLARENSFKLITENWKLKIGITSIALLVLGFVLFHYYQIAKETFSLMLNTVYPGKRFSTGGDLIDGKLFADFFSMFMTDTNMPKQWQNICEESGAIMFFPILFYAMAYYFIKYRKFDVLLLSLSAFVIFTLIYVLVGIPAFLSKITLFSMSPAFRTLPLLGIGSCILLICYIGSDKLESKKANFSWLECGILAIATFIFMRIVGTNINKATENFFTNSQVNIVSALVTIGYLLTRYKDLRFAKYALCLVLFIMVISNAGVNPLTRGLSPILENPLTQVSKEINTKDPGYKWALFGNVRLTHLVKASGSTIINGVKYVPPMEMMKILDPKKVYDSIYNRYAWASMQWFVSPNDTVVFKQTFNDGYAMFIDPCSPKLKQLKVKYFVFDHKPDPAEIRCMTKVAEPAGLLVYKRTDF